VYGKYKTTAWNPLQIIFFTKMHWSRDFDLGL